MAELAQFLAILFSQNGFLVHKGDGSFCVHVAQELLTNINKNTSRSLLK